MYKANDNSNVLLRFTPIYILQIKKVNNYGYMI
ncbi:hypothetical protein FHS90_003815 [Rufibacter quisquiliarum]|uniref:Uncharacterized protein n=1 Tax=Rufibacter quisquiliarum TaxID=1549639 RepID=A0A839GK94_9BACT|nr:hypothetical protein [Rufibacter quisquiliarum]